MSELALRLIAENKAKHARGEDARVLDLGNCGLTEVPTEISKLTWLEELVLSEEWSEDTIFDSFSVSHRSLNHPDNFLFYEEDEEEIKWNPNRIKSFPNIFFSFPKLKKLIAQGYDGWLISDLTPLVPLNSLIDLNLSNTEIVDISPLENLTNLSQLWLTGTKITDLNPVSSLDKLTKLYFAYTPVKDLRPLANLHNLTHLDLSCTDVYDLTPLSSLTKLVGLGISETSVKDLTPITNLVELGALDISHTYIDDLSALKGMDNLYGLDISDSNVTDLTPIVGLISKGIPIGWTTVADGIQAEGCKLSHPPVEIYKQGNAAILRYFEDLEKSGSDQIYEAKLLLLGEGGAGKTSLCRKLFDPEAELPQEKDRTKGIDIHSLYFDVPGQEGKIFRLNIWDFAGQGKYQSVHSFFYTHRSLYVFVDDTRTLNENDAFRTLYNNWLQTAELFGGNSPVVILHNEKEGCARTGFSIGGFKERFDFVHGDLFRINLGGQDTSKIIDLKNQIQRLAVKLPHIGDTVPKTWVKVREAIEAERQRSPYISIERYRELCATVGILDPDRQSDLSQYFHDLGVFLHFRDNTLLKRDVFLQNQWVTDAVYKILDDTQIAGAQRGRFDRKDLARLWNESTYRDRRDELLALMLQFEICYQVQDSETYICPQLLPGDLPSYNLGVGIPLQLKYEYGFMPKGLFYRLMVRLHRHIAQRETAVWNSGVVLERAGAIADITESLDRRTITLRATGQLARELVTIIHDTLESLHSPFGDRLKVEVKIPCNCKICRESNTPHFYDKKDLDTRVVKGKGTIECSMSYDDVPVKDLLEGVFVKNITRHSKDKLKLFISYSRHDDRHKDTLIKHLSPLRNKIITWHDQDILPGEDWDEGIKINLHEADVVLYLVTHHSLATEYIQNVEMPIIEQRCEEKECILVPVIVDYCAWEQLDFAKRNALPAKGTPITDKQWTNENQAWVDVIKGIQRLITA